MNITRALVVDDSKTARISLKKQMEKRGIEVDVAETGEEALSYLRSCAPLYPDIIFMDIMMPGIDGLEATKSITSTPETAMIPVIMCTSKDDEKTKIAAQENGAIGFAVKPIKGDELDRSLQMASDQIADLDQALETADSISPGTPQIAATLSAEDTTSITEQVTQLAQRVAAQVAEDTATKIGQSTAQATAEHIAQKAKSVAEGVAHKNAEAVAVRISEQTAVQHTRKMIEQISQQLVTQTVKEEIEKVRAEINTELTNHLGAFLRSAQVSSDIQRLIQDKAANTATAITQQAIKDNEGRADEIARMAAKKAVTGVKVLTYLLTLSTLGIAGYLVANVFLG